MTAADSQLGNSGGRGERGGEVVRFYTGTHQPHWLHRVEFPLLVSHRQLGRRVRRRPYRRAACRWALDSGGFSELRRHGAWSITPAAYVAAVGRYADEIGGLEWAAIQDWMCEPFMVARTGLSVREHQARTVGNYLDLRALAPDLPFIPVLQGFTRGEYLECLARYDRAGIDLEAEPLVGLGSVCRRQSDQDIQALVTELAAAGFRLHGFGIKVRGFRRYGHLLESADSMAWSYAARRSPPLPGHRHAHCNNCLEYARAWRTRVLRTTAHQQLTLDIPVPITAATVHSVPTPRAAARAGHRPTSRPTAGRRRGGLSA